MPSRLPEDVLVTLLRQCFITPRCQLLRQCRQPGSRSSRALHTSRACLPRKDRRWAIEGRQPRCKAHNESLNGLKSQSARILFSRNNSIVAAAATAKTPDAPQKPATKIAILGGGITGLASAHYLTRLLPHAEVTIYEGGDRLGGWLRSKHVQVKGGNVVFEQGPRTLRPHSPTGMVTLEMIKNLNLGDELLITSRVSAAAQNRFIYYPDHLVKMPGPGQDIWSIAWTTLTEQVFTGFLRGAVFEYSRPTRPSELDDESIGSFLNRRFGAPDLGNNIASAVLHGIYAGDIYQLSAKSLLGKMWNDEVTYGSITQANIQLLSKRESSMLYKDATLQTELAQKFQGWPVLDVIRDASVYTFKKGIATLSDALARDLRANPKVKIILNTKITGIDYDAPSKSVKIQTNASSPPATYNHTISTLSASRLSSLSQCPLPTLELIHSVTVMVINLFYPNPDLLPEHGFGYLIPRSIPYSQNPESALGVVFDSDSSMGQDTAPGTKITVMMGGHWWDGLSPESLPDEAEGVEMAKRVLARHLNIQDEPEATNVTLQRDCIPQYTVGHEARLKKAHGELMAGFKGRLSVAGAWMGGVGLNDCVRGARDLAIGLEKELGRNAGEDGLTGLENWVGPRAWVQVRIPK